MEISKFCVISKLILLTVILGCASFYTPSAHADSSATCNGSIWMPGECAPDGGCTPGSFSPPDPTWDCNVHNTVNFVNNTLCSSIVITQVGNCQFTSSQPSSITIGKSSSSSFAISSPGIMNPATQDGSAYCTYVFTTYDGGLDNPQTTGTFSLKITTQDFVTPLNPDGSPISTNGIGGLSINSISTGSHSGGQSSGAQTLPATISLYSESLCKKEPPF